MKQYSSKRSIQILADLLRQSGIADIVISPGSRNAPMAIHFSESGFNCYSIVDERSAAFVALGMAKSLGRPVALSCTSGSASVNYYPAVVEAFYQNVPLLLLTADRPADYVDLFDGQTIRQKELFRQHSYGDFQLKEDDDADAELYNLRTVTTAIEICNEKQGPVHINVPLSEPLYELVDEVGPIPQVEFHRKKKQYKIAPSVIAGWNTAKRILILTGQLDPSDELNGLLAQLVKNHSAVVLTEATSNLYHAKFFSHIDRYIFGFDETDFTTYAPDLLITVGQNVVSKKVKQFLRKARPGAHWHVDPYWHPDTYFALSQKIEADPVEFFGQLLQQVTPEPQPYYNLWNNLREKKDAAHRQYLENVPFSDFYIFKQLENAVPDGYRIHISNSSPIRYAQLFDFTKEHEVYCNRGVSGIDGCTSTAMGFAIKENAPVLLVTGELSFFYDINGLWNKYIPSTARIIVINNGEGSIFRIIPGPEDTRAVDDLIATKHHLQAEHLAKHFNMEYLYADNAEGLMSNLSHFFESSERPIILEVNTADRPNATVLKEYFKSLG